MIKKPHKGFVQLEVPLRVEVNPRLTVKFEDGIVTLYSRGNTIRMTEWEFDEVSMMHSVQKISEIVARQKPKK